MGGTGDAWEPQDDDQAEGEQDEGEGAGGGDEGPTPDELKAIRELRATGMTVAEAKARATRDYERDAADSGGAGGQGTPARKPRDPNAVVTQAELEEMNKDASAQARLILMQQRLRETLEETVEKAMQEEGLEASDAEEFASIAQAVGRALKGNVRLGQMTGRELRQAAAETTKAVIEKKRKVYGGAKTDDDEAAHRVRAQGAVGEATSRGGSGRRTVGEPLEPEGEEEEQVWGVGEKMRFPSEDEIEATHQKRLAKFRKEHK